MRQKQRDVPPSTLIFICAIPSLHQGCSVTLDWWLDGFRTPRNLKRPDLRFRCLALGVFDGVWVASVMSRPPLGARLYSQAPHSKPVVKEAVAMEISREELYRRVWELPVVTLAQEFDISDVGLSKACRANGIPLPPRGYWMKLQHGKSVTKPALPPSTVTAVVIDAPRHRLPVPPNRKRPASFVGPLPESTRQWLATAELLADAADPVLQRVQCLASGIKMDYYSGSFGRPVA